MKKMFILFFAFFVIQNQAFSIDNNFFRYGFGGYSSAIDVENGNDLNHIESYYNFKNKDLLTYCDIYVTGKDHNSFFHIEYINGLESKEHSKVYEERETLSLYDENLNLLSNSENQYFVYVSESQRKYINSEKLQEIQEIETSNDYIKIKYTEFSSKLGDKEVFNNGYIIDEYFYQEDKLVHFEKNRWNKKNVHSEFVETLDFFYDEENRLIKTVQGYGPKDIRYIRNMLYDEENRIKCINITYYEQQKEQNESVEFSAYDINGNWKECKIYKNAELIEQITREINYVE